MSKRNVTTEQLLDWIEGRLDEDSAAEVQGKMTAADQEEWVWLKQFHERTDEMHFVPLPNAAWETLSERFVQTRKQKVKPTVWQRFVAQWDQGSPMTGEGLALAGARDVSVGMEAIDDETAQEQQHLFTSEPIYLALHILTNNEGSFTVDGQIFPNIESASNPFVVQLITDGETIALLSSDDLGEFTITSVPSGVYEMVLCNDEIEIVIPEIVLSIS